LVRNVDLTPVSASIAPNAPDTTSNSNSQRRY
jgi:hypothetical protein